MTEIIIIILCLILNGLLSGIEMAFVTVSKSQLKKLIKDGSHAAERVLKLKANPERSLSVLQIGITLVGAISAATSGAGAEEYLSPLFMETFGFTEELSESLSIATVVLPLTYFSVVVGELVPKSIALKHPLKIALLGGYLLQLLDRVFAPFVWFLEISTKFITQILFKNVKSQDHQEAPSELDLDNLNETHKQFVINLIGVDKRTLKQVMVPWDQVTQIKFDDHYHDVLEIIKISRHTRIPVVKDGEVIGILYTKEFVAEAEVAKIEWTTLIRKALFLSPQDLVINSLKVMQSGKNHMAIVKTKHSVLGIVTLEDILEEFIGEIYDEDDDPRRLFSVISKIRNNNFKY